MEYADEYTKKEKVIRFIVFAVLGLAVITVHKLVIFPWLTEFSQKPHCFEIFGLNGADYLWHFVFIGVPIPLFVVALFMLPIGIKGLQERRYPPKSMKVYRQTVVKRGYLACLQSSLFIAMPLLIVCFAVWGYYQIDNMPLLDASKLSPHLCHQ